MGMGENGNVKSHSRTSPVSGLLFMGQPADIPELAVDVAVVGRDAWSLQQVDTEGELGANSQVFCRAATCTCISACLCARLISGLCLTFTVVLSSVDAFVFYARNHKTQKWRSLGSKLTCSDLLCISCKLTTRCITRRTTNPHSEPKVYRKSTASCTPQHVHKRWTCKRHWRSCSSEHCMNSKL